MLIDALMVSCPERDRVREETLESFRQSDWHPGPSVLVDAEQGVPSARRICSIWQKAIAYAERSAADLVLLVEDDIIVNRWLKHNVSHWRPVLERPHKWFYGSLYNPRVFRLRDDPMGAYFCAHPESVWGAQALLISPQTAAFIHANWNKYVGVPDCTMPQIAAEKSPIFYHSPSLVNHRLAPSTWGGLSHQAIDFAPQWKAACSRAD
jgi:hypothetical protein